MNTDSKILRLPQVLKKVGLGRSSVYLGMKEGTFPKQIKLGERSSGWIESEIDEWIFKRASER